MTLSELKLVGLVRLDIWQVCESSLELLTAPALCPLLKIFNTPQSGELLCYRSADELMDRDAVLARQFPDLFVERIWEPEADRTHGDTPPPPYSAGSPNNPTSSFFRLASSSSVFASSTSRR